MDGEYPEADKNTSEQTSLQKKLRLRTSRALAHAVARGDASSSEHGNEEEAVHAREGARQLRGLQPLPAWQGEIRLRGLQPVPAW